MHKVKTAVIAAIPNYNMAPALDRLLAQLVTADYDGIYVLDDASTDNSIQVVKNYHDVQLIQNNVNQGSGATRNRILEVVDDQTIIHFLDADVILESAKPAAAIRALNLTAKSGFVGGTVITPKGTQDPWNYGPRLRFWTDLTVPFYQFGVMLPSKLRTAVLSRFRDRPYSTNTTFPYWVLESNLIIHAETMRQLGGFDAKSREHDIQPMAATAYQQKRRNSITNTVVVTRYNDLQVRGAARPLQFIATHLRIIRQSIGWKNYFR